MASIMVRLFYRLVDISFREGVTRHSESVDNNSLYTQPEDILNIQNRLSKIGPYFSIAAGFGNVHGVYVCFCASILVTG